MVPNFGSLIVKSGCNIRSRRKSFVTSVKIFFFAALPYKPAEADKKLFRMNPAYSILHLENQDHGKSCYVGVWGDIYIRILTNSFTSLLRRKICLSCLLKSLLAQQVMPSPPSTTRAVVFEQGVLHVTADVWLTAKTSGCTEQPPRVNV